MKYKELQRLKMDTYKAFIEQKYGKSALDKLEVAINTELTNKILQIRDDQKFLEEIEELRNTKDED